MRAWFVATLLLLALAAPGARAGTQKAPEITDPADDQQLTPAGMDECVAGNCEFSAGADILAVWVGGETATQIHFFAQLSGSCPGNLATYVYEVDFKVAGTAHKASATCLPLPEGHAVPGGDGTMTPGDDASGAVFNDVVLDLMVTRAKIGSPAAGAVLSDLAMSARGDAYSSGQTYVNDQAPDTGVSTKTYTFTMGPGGNATGGTHGNTTAPPTSTSMPGNTTAPPANATASPSTTPAPTTSHPTTSPPGTSSGRSSSPATTSAKGSPAAGAGLGILALAAVGAGLRRRQA